MNEKAKHEIDDILTGYLSMLADAQADVNSGYGIGPVDYMKALERQKLLTESVNAAVDAINQIVYVGGLIKEAK